MPSSHRRPILACRAVLARLVGLIGIGISIRDLASVSVSVSVSV